MSVEEDQPGVADRLSRRWKDLTSVSNRFKGRRPEQIDDRTHLLRAEKNLFKSLRGGDAGRENKEERAEEDEHSSARTLGAFEGVFAPVTLSMLSSVLFLRVGYIVGNAGLWQSFIQYAIAYSILVTTVLSISAIATNGAVEGGGIYFMLSRTLGAEFGGAVGTLFFFSNIVASALYITACTEGLVSSFGPEGMIANFLSDESWHLFVYSSVINTINLGVCLIGSRMFGRATTVILAGVFACTAVTFASYFRDFEYEKDFYFNTTEATECTPAKDNASQPNCTKVDHGVFLGFAAASGENITTNLVENLNPRYEFDCSSKVPGNVNFATVFGVLFSGMTGIMTGANLSGELVNPANAIPKGTLGACATTLVIFIAMTLLTALTSNPELLLHDCMYLQRFAFWKPIVTVGVLLATLSASLNNLIGSSRVLKAVAKDVMFGPLLDYVTKGTWNENPIAAVVTSWVLVELFLVMGSLNSIAQLVSVLKLLCYASVNIACLGLDFASAPNFRPSFKYFSWHTCLFGLAGSVTMMFAVSPMFSAVAILLCVSLVFALNLFSPMRKQANWGSISQALLFHQVRKYLLLLDPRKSHVKFWRPQILLLVSNPRTSCSLIDFVNALKKGGLYVLGHVYQKKSLEEFDGDPCVAKTNDWLALVDHLRIKAFVELTVASSLREGIQHLVRISGLGAMKPNTIVMGFLERDDTDADKMDDFLNPGSPYATRQFEDGAFPPLKGKDRSVVAGSVLENPARLNRTEYVGVLRDLLKMQKNVCISRHFQQLNNNPLEALSANDQNPKSLLEETVMSPRFNWFGKKVSRKNYLDVWLVDFFKEDPGETDISDTTSLFLLQLACIVNMVPRWKKMTIRVFVTVPRDASDETSISQRLVVSRMLQLLRIRATCQVIKLTPDHLGLAPDSPSSLEFQSPYLKAVADIVRKYTADTAVVFLYLPDLPKPQEEADDNYLWALATLTAAWPPTLMVRGVSPVTSITL